MNVPPRPAAASPSPPPPPSATAGEHFYPASAFAELSRREAQSFWFQSRNRILLSTLRRAAKNRPALRYAEIGCGTGFVLAAVAEHFNQWRVNGFDIHAEAVAYSRLRAPRAHVAQADLHHLTPGDNFDLIGVFDVLEHLDDAPAALRGIHGQLASGGQLVLTVPQHPSLWSPYDEAARHRRRYTRTAMRALLHENGFRIDFLSSFVSLLWPALWWRRRSMRHLAPDQAAALSQADLTPPAWQERIGQLAMKPDEWAAKLGLPIPFGGSLLAVATKEG